MELNRNQIVIVYRRAILVGCSKNNINFPDQLQDKLLVHFFTLLDGGYTIATLHTFSEPVD